MRCQQYTLYCVYFLIYFCCLSETEYNLFNQRPVVNNVELRDISEKLFNILTSDLYLNVTINYQNKVTSKNLTDRAPERLLTVMPEVLKSKQTIQGLFDLYDNYEINVKMQELVSEEENAEENAFIDVILASDFMKMTMDFLSQKGYFTSNFEEHQRILKTIWFKMYPRGKHIRYNGSSGFEHIFLIEKKNNHKLIGLHNWIFFQNEEKYGRLNYMGYIRNVALSNKAAVAFVHFKHMGIHKASSMFIGTSPEFEIALYTLCFYTRPNKSCRITLGGVKLTIQTFQWKIGNYKLISAAYPAL